MKWKVAFIISTILLILSCLYHFVYAFDRYDAIQFQKENSNYKDYQIGILNDIFIAGKNRMQIKEALKPYEGKYSESDSIITFLNFVFIFNEKDSIVRFKY